MKGKRGEGLVGVASRRQGGSEDMQPLVTKDGQGSAAVNRGNGRRRRCGR